MDSGLRLAKTVGPASVSEEDSPDAGTAFVTRNWTGTVVHASSTQVHLYLTKSVGRALCARGGHSRRDCLPDEQSPPSSVFVASSPPHHLRMAETVGPVVFSSHAVLGVHLASSETVRRRSVYVGHIRVTPPCPSPARHYPSLARANLSSLLSASRRFSSLVAKLIRT